MKLENPLKKITMGDAVDFAINRAEKAPALEARIKELERENQSLKSDVELLKKASAFFARTIK